MATLTKLWSIKLTTNNEPLIVKVAADNITDAVAIAEETDHQNVTILEIVNIDAVYHKGPAT